MLETILTTNEALRLSLAMSGLCCIIALGMLAIVAYLLRCWQQDLDGLKSYLEARGITDTDAPTVADMKEAMSR